jgi:hypothetical protein
MRRKSVDDYRAPANVLTLSAAAERPYIGVGGIIPSPPTQPLIGTVQHGVGGKLREDRHPNEMMPEAGNDKNCRR